MLVLVSLCDERVVQALGFDFMGLELSKGCLYRLTLSTGSVLAVINKLLELVALLAKIARH